MLRRLLPLFIISMIFSLTAFSQYSPSRSKILTIKRTIEQKHYSPRAVNDSFSANLYDQFIAALNEEVENVAISKNDLTQLQRYRLQLDDELNGTGWKFLDSASAAFKRTLLKADESAASNKQMAAVHRSIRRIIDNPRGFNEYVSTIYADVLANCFDPHTEYMPKEEKEEFESELSTQGYYFGFTLELNDDKQIEIGRVMPGSPAWKSGDLNTGDIIVSMGWEGSEKLKIEDARLQEISRLLSGNKDKKLLITVKKANGIEKTTELFREKMDNEENNVRGYVLKGARNVGYIYLPDFYTQQEGVGGSSANDVAKAIIKLKKESIDALILDLRYNGGGSLVEAMEMAGIFIDFGPLGMLVEKDGKSQTLKDINRGTIYTGPLAILINGQSASASEFLSAVLQNYNRAIVVGSRSFGKGSAQQIFPVDTTNMPAISDPEYGYVKVTTGKFYRVNGSTTQYAGVTPDVRLPDIFDSLNYREASLPYALATDSIKGNSYFKPLNPLPVQLLAGKSATRVKDASFMSRPSNRIFTADINSFDSNLVLSNSYLSAINDKWKNKIIADIYIEETYNILNDLVTIQPQ